MAAITITDLPSASALDGTEAIPLVQGGATKKTTVADLTALVYAQLPGFPYVPSTPADWAGDPASVEDALNRLAAAVAGLLGGPIP